MAGADGTAATARQNPRTPSSSTSRQPAAGLGKWKLVLCLVVFSVLCGGAFVLFNPAAVRWEYGKFTFVVGLLLTLLVMLLALPSKPLVPGGSTASSSGRVSRIAANKNRIALAHQRKLDAARKRE